MLGLCMFFANQLSAQTPQAIAYYQQAQTAFEQNKEAEAIELLNKAIGDSPQYERALLTRANYYADNRQPSRAIEDFTLLVRIAPKNILYWVERGNVWQQEGNYDEAESDFLEAHSRDTTSIEPLNALGGLYFVADLPKDATIFLNKAVALESKNYDARYARAWVLFELKKFDLALLDLKVCEQVKKDDINTQRLKAICYLKQKKQEETIKIFEGFSVKKIKMVEEDFLYWGMAYYEKGDYKNALFYLSIPDNPASPDIYHYLAKTYFQLNDLKKASQKLDTALLMLKIADVSGVETELSAPVYYDRAIVRQKAGKRSEANTDLLMACYLTPEIVAQKDYEGNSFSLLGDALIILKPTKKTLDSTRVKGYQDRAEAFIITGNSNSAWTEVEKSNAIDSLHSRNAWLQAKIAIMLGKYPDAITYLQKATRLPKGKSEEDIAYLRAIAYQEKGDIKEAKEAIQQAIKINQNETSYKSLLANIEYSAANPKAAVDAINDAIKKEPQNLGYYLERAIYWQALANYEEAIKDCNKVLEKEADNREAYYQRGLAYRATKRYKDALTDFQKVEQYDNDDTEIKELITEMKSK